MFTVWAETRGRPYLPYLISAEEMWLNTCREENNNEIKVRNNKNNLKWNGQRMKKNEQVVEQLEGIYV